MLYKKEKEKAKISFAFLHFIIIVFFISLSSFSSFILIVFREQVRSCLIETRSRGYHQLCLLFFTSREKKKKGAARQNPMSRVEQYGVSDGVGGRVEWDACGVDEG